MNKSHASKLTTALFVVQKALAQTFSSEEVRYAGRMIGVAVLFAIVAWAYIIYQIMGVFN